MSGQRIGLVGCVKAKAPVRSAAQDLYISTLFRGRRAYVERSCSQWWVLSALHGLVDPDQELEPYDVTLKDATAAQRRAWSQAVLKDLVSRAGVRAGDVVEIHAGVEYRGFGLVDGLERMGVVVEVPAAGMRQGQQLQFYRDIRAG